MQRELLPAIRQHPGQIQAGRAQAKADKSNAVQQEREADRVEEAARLEEFRNRQKIDGIKGAQAAGQAANGVLIDSGSPLEILADTAAEGAFEAFMIRENSARQRRSLLEGASLDRASAKNARTGALLNAGGTLLSGAGKVAQKWYERSKYTAGAPVTRPR